MFQHFLNSSEGLSSLNIIFLIFQLASKALDMKVNMVYSMNDVLLVLVETLLNVPSMLLLVHHPQHSKLDKWLGSLD